MIRKDLSVDLLQFTHLPCRTPDLSVLPVVTFCEPPSFQREGNVIKWNRKKYKEQLYQGVIKMKAEKDLGDSEVGCAELSMRAVTPSLQKLCLHSTSRVIFA